MEWLTENGFFVLLWIAFIALHVFGHGGHGAHRRRPDATREGHDGHTGRRAPGEGYGA